MKKLFVIILAILFLSLFFFPPTPTPTPTITPEVSTPYPTPQPHIKAKVTKVIDGDTIVISDGNQVRLIGIDTPELKKCFYQEAKDTTTALVSGQEVELESDINDKDDYGRLLRYVYVEGEMVNEFLVTWGFAEAEDFFPEKRHYTRFLSAQKEAQKQNRGLWGKCN